MKDKKPVKHITTYKTERTIKKNLRELRKFIDTTDDKLAMRIAYAMETAVRWTIEETSDWGTLVAEAQKEAETARKLGEM